MDGSNGPVAGQSFEVKDCALAAIATGRRAQGMRELVSRLQIVESASIYYHFWGTMLRPSFVTREYNNDFAFWVRHAIHDSVLTERLSVIDPTDYADIEDLRRELIEVIEERLDELQTVPFSRSDQQFYFVRSQIVIFNTDIRIDQPLDLARQLPLMSNGSIFYHFIDARRRTPDGVDDFRAWLRVMGAENQPAIDRLAAIDPYFSTLPEIRQELADLFMEIYGGASAS